MNSAQWLGHVDPHRTTEEWYESHAPAYLETCKTGVDAIMGQLHEIAQRHKKPRPILPPNLIAGTSLIVIDNEKPEKLPVSKKDPKRSK
ncbi:hypothetical protein [Rhodomicrobium vannielii]|uniref:hypothetical protein n=1 Tax=Rhodomicrobium vannielii TaxID=1069 RepID=UPI0012DDD9C1|nr:hypothetical protein [Rhodomicrobium vannielii]